MNYLYPNELRYINYIYDIDHPLFNFCKKHKLSIDNIYKYSDPHTFKYYNILIRKISASVHTFVIHENVRMLRYFVSFGLGYVGYSVYPHGIYENVDIINYMLSIGEEWIANRCAPMNVSTTRYLVSFGTKNIDYVFNIAIFCDMFDICKYLASLGGEYKRSYRCVGLIRLKILKFIVSLGDKHIVRDIMYRHGLREEVREYIKSLSL